MKKALISAAILVGFAGAAQAQMTIYGLLDASVGKSVYDDAAGLKTDFHSGGDGGSSEGNSTSRFGIKGSMDVGSGFKANFKLESNGITSDGEVNDPFFGRQAWFGFSGDFGEVRFGRQDSVPFQTMIGYDFNGASNGVSSLGYASVGPWLPGRQSRSLQYLSPSFAGVTFQVGFVPKGNVDGAKDTLSAGVTYAAGPLSVSAAVESKREDGGANFGSVAASYDFGVVKAMAAYTDGAEGVKGYSLGVVAPVAGFSIGGLVGKNSDTKGVAYEFFINKEVLKNTYAYFEVGHADKKAMASFELDKAGTGYALGVIYAF